MQQKIAALQYIHEILFSLTVGFVCTVAVVPRLPESLVHSLFLLNVSIYIRLHMQHSPDLLTYDFVFLIIGTALALCIWTVLRLSSASLLTRQTLRSAGGVMAVAALPVLWSVENRPWHLG